MSRIFIPPRELIGDKETQQYEAITAIVRKKVTRNLMDHKTCFTSIGFKDNGLSWYPEAAIMWAMWRDMEEVRRSVKPGEFWCNEWELHPLRDGMLWKTIETSAYKAHADCRTGEILIYSKHDEYRQELRRLQRYYYLMELFACYVLIGWYALCAALLTYVAYIYGVTMTQVKLDGEAALVGVALLFATFVVTVAMQDLMGYGRRRRAFLTMNENK